MYGYDGTPLSDMVLHIKPIKAFAYKGTKQISEKIFASFFYYMKEQTDSSQFKNKYGIILVT